MTGMPFSEKNRPRLLIISKDKSVRNDLIILLSGCGYFVDYVETRSEGIAKFRNYKHVIVILDVQALPRHPQRMFNLFRIYKKNPIILIAAHRDEEDQVYPFMKLGIFDILPLPFKVDYLYFVLKRLVEHSRLTAQNAFIKLCLLMILITWPIWAIAIWFFAKNFPR